MNINALLIIFPKKPIQAGRELVDIFCLRTHNYQLRHFRSLLGGNPHKLWLEQACSLVLLFITRLSYSEQFIDPCCPILLFIRNCSRGKPINFCRTSSESSLRRSGHFQPLAVYQVAGRQAPTGDVFLPWACRSPPAGDHNQNFAGLSWSAKLMLTCGWFSFSFFRQTCVSRVPYFFPGANKQR